MNAPSEKNDNVGRVTGRLNAFAGVETSQLDWLIYLADLFRLMQINLPFKILSHIHLEGRLICIVSCFLDGGHVFFAGHVAGKKELYVLLSCP